MELLTQPLSPLRSDAPRPVGGETADATLKQAVRGLITRLSPMVTRDRRRYARHPLPMLMELTAVDIETGEPVGEPLIVVGKSLSEHGIGFFHQHAIPYRHALVRIEDSSERETSFLVDLAWCRYTRFGWYESGGRFLKVLEPTSI